MAPPAHASTVADGPEYDGRDRQQQPVSLEFLRDSMRQFAAERDWQRFHTPRNLLLALVTMRCYTRTLFGLCLASLIVLLSHC